MKSSGKSRVRARNQKRIMYTRGMPARRGASRPRQTGQPVIGEASSRLCYLPTGSRVEVKQCTDRALWSTTARVPAPQRDSRVRRKPRFPSPSHLVGLRPPRRSLVLLLFRDFIRSFLMAILPVVVVADARRALLLPLKPGFIASSRSSA